MHQDPFSAGAVVYDASPDSYSAGELSERGRSKANMSWIFLKIPPGNLLEICLIKFVDTLLLLLLVFLLFI